MNYAKCGRCSKKGVHKINSELHRKTTTIECKYCNAIKIYKSYGNEANALTLEDMGLHISDDFRRYQPPPRKPITTEEALNRISFARGDLDAIEGKLSAELIDYASQIRDVLDALETYLRQTDK